MPNAFIIHGAFGNPDENWFPWLKIELEKINIKTEIPQFPTPEGQTLDNWLAAFKPYEKQVTKETIMIAHSLGPALILNLLEKNIIRIKSAYFISGFIGRLNDPEFDTINSTFTEKDFDWQKIRNNCENFTVIHSDNDPYVKIQKAKELAKNLGTKPIIIPCAGHFNTQSGYKEFPYLLEKIKNLNNRPALNSTC